MLSLVARTRSAALPDMWFDEFAICSFEEDLDRDRVEMMLCPVKAITHCFSKMDQHCPVRSNSFISTGEKKKCVTKNLISFGLRFIINEVHRMASDSHHSYSIKCKGV